MLYVIELNDKKYGVELYDDMARIKEESLLGNQSVATVDQEDAFEVEDIPDLFLDIDDEKSTSVTATMPGVVISILAIEGELVKEGQLLIVYESMKMENEVLSPVNGKVIKVNIKEGDKIEIGQTLITFLGDR